jgi:hypothetical protein
MRLASEHSRRATSRHAIGDFLKAAFWHDRWKKDQIGFHNEEVHERLTRHWPHSVPPSEVEALFGSSFDVETLWSSGWIDAPPRFRARGLETQNDTVMRLDRGGPA